METQTTQQEPLRAFHSSQEIKDKYINRVKMHREADNLIQGTGWKDGKGCAVGCTLENYNHARYPIELGIPQVLAALEDRIFEGLANEKAQLWPEEFLSAITPGANLENVGWVFLRWLLVDKEWGVIKFARTDEQQKAIADVADLLLRKINGENATREEFLAARKAAYAAAADAADAAYAAAAYAAAYAAAHAAYSAAAAAADAADAADARKKFWIAAKDQLLELLRDAKRQPGA